MASKIEWEKISMGIIVAAGSAKSSAMEGLFAAKDGDYETATKKMVDAEKEIGEASHLHFEVIQEEAKGTQLEFRVLFLHAEDQLLTTQTLILLVQEMIELHQKIDDKHK